MERRADLVVTDSNKRTALHLASICGSEDSLRAMIDQMPAVTSQKQGQAPQTPRKFNLDARDSTGRTPLHYAAEGGHVTCVAYLISKRVDVRIRLFCDYD